MRLNWLTPLGEGASGSTLRWLQVLPRLGTEHEITIWSADRDVPEGLQGIDRVARFDEGAVPWAELNRAEATIFHLDSTSAACAGIWRVSQKHRGIVVLHSANLWDLFVRLARSGGDERDTFERFLASAHGATNRAEVTRWLDGGEGDEEELRQRYPCLELGIRGAFGVLLADAEASSDDVRAACPLRSAGTDPAGWPSALAALLDEAERYRPRAVADRVAALVATELGAWAGHVPALAPSAEDELVDALVDPLRAAAKALERGSRRLTDELACRRSGSGEEL